jgi:AcrR family transcriptional regulator
VSGPYASIQVRDITDRADVGYATFYRHYKDKDDLMLMVFEEITNDLEDSAGELRKGYFEREGLLLFGHIQKYSGFYRSIMNNAEFVKKLKTFLAVSIEEHIANQLAPLQDLAFPIDLAAHHMIISLVGLIDWWLDTDMKIKVDEMAQIYQRLIVQATWYALDKTHRLTFPERNG